VEISCPPDCGYLASAREHPAAVVRRQQARDVGTLLPSIRHLTERQYQLFFLFQTAIARYQPDGLARLVDGDVAEAAASLAATLETSSRGVIYEHAAPTRASQQLARELQGVLGAIREQGGQVYDGEAAIVLRAIEQGARESGEPPAGETAYLELMARLLQTDSPRTRQGTTGPLVSP
jgi:hypothetical protein